MLSPKQKQEFLANLAFQEFKSRFTPPTRQEKLEAHANKVQKMKAAAKTANAALSREVKVGMM